MLYTSAPLGYEKRRLFAICCVRLDSTQNKLGEGSASYLWGREVNSSQCLRVASKKWLENVPKASYTVHPSNWTWNLKITHVPRKNIMFGVPSYFSRLYSYSWLFFFSTRSCSAILIHQPGFDLKWREGQSLPLILHLNMSVICLPPKFPRLIHLCQSSVTIPTQGGYR